MIIPVGTWSNTYLSYDTETLEYIVNPNGDSLGMFALGFNNTRISLADLSALHDGNDIFSGRADYIGHWAAFPFLTNMYGTITDFVRVKKYVDRDPVLVYTGLTTLAEVDLTEDPLNPLQVYYDAPFTVDAGYGYQQLVNTYRWYFTKGVYGTIQKTISFTDADTGRSATTPNIAIEFRENNGIIFDAVELYTFGIPRLTTASIITSEDIGGVEFVSSVTDAIGSDNPYINNVVADRPFKQTNVVGGKGIAKTYNDNNYLQKTYKSDSALNTLTSFTIVFEISMGAIINPNAAAYSIFDIENFFTLRCSIFSNKWRMRVWPQGQSEVTTPSSPLTAMYTTNDLAVCALSINTINGTINYRDSLGNTLNITSFVKGTGTDISTVFSKFSTSEGFRGQIHRKYILPYETYNDSEKTSEIFAQTVLDYGPAIPASDGTTITADSFPEMTADSFPVDTTF